MKAAIFLVLLIFLQISIFVHFQFIRSYIFDKQWGRLKKFLVVALINIFIGIILLAGLMGSPEFYKTFSLGPVLILESGIIFLILVFVKVRITLRVIKRSKSPEYYDISFFGRKVYRLNIVKKTELAIYILSMPITLIAGAYFIVNVFLD